MLEELHPSNLFQQEQEHLSTPTVSAHVHEAGTMPGDKGGKEHNMVATSIDPRAQTPTTAARPLAQVHEQEPPQQSANEQEDDDGEDRTETPGYTYLEEDDPFFAAPGLHEQVSAGAPGPVAGRTRSARRHTTTSSANSITYVSDCAPAFVAQAATVATDLATNHRTPKHYGEAMTSPDRKHWQQAIKTELDAVKAAGTYRLVPLSRVPDGCRVIGYTWVFKIKNREDGSIARYKARICVDGSKQKHGIDYDQTFAPVANATTIRLVLAIAASKGLHMRQYDVETAFLASMIDKPAYMRAPRGAGGETGQAWLLLRSLYGLKQAPRLFNTHLNKNLHKHGFTQSLLDPCLYHRFKTGTETYLAVVVDDILLATNSASYAKQFEADLGSVYKLKLLGKPAYMVGMQLGHYSDKLTVCQNRYIADVAKRFGESNPVPTRTPANVSVSLVRTGIARKPPSTPVNPTKYRSLVGALMYTVMTRPDVATPVSMCARYLQEPRQAHWLAAIKILQYLVSTPEVHLTYRRGSPLNLTCYVDSSWADDKDTRRSRYGYAVYLGTSLLEWKSKLHACITLSTAESEYVAATEACKAVVWLRNTLQELHIPQTSPTAVFEDNQACIHMAANRMITGRNKHMEIKQHYVRHLSRNGTVQLVYIHTKRQRADILTKNLAYPDFVRMRELLLGRSPHVADE
jgi:hypothetical protein